jgi:putative transposase
LRAADDFLRERAGSAKPKDMLKYLRPAPKVSGQLVGMREVEEKIWLVSFLDFDLGYFDEVEGQVEPGPNLFAAKVLTMPSV